MVTPRFTTVQRIGRLFTIAGVTLVGLLLGAAVVSGGPGPAAPAPPQASWRMMPTRVRTTLNEVSVGSPTSVIILGDDSSLMRWNGISWTVTANPAACPLSSITMGSPTDAWAVGTCGAERTAVTAHWDGANWTAESYPYSGLNRVDAISPTAVWAVGGIVDWIPCNFWHFDGQGWHGELISGGGCDALYSLDVVSETTGWVAGHDMWWAGSPFFLQKDGEVWTQTYSGYAQRGPLAVVSDNDVWVGDYDQFWHWNGSVWTQFANPSGRPIHGISMVAGADGWAVGPQGTIMHWDGQAWSQVTSPTSADLNKIDMLSADYGWAVGRSGVALVYGDPGSVRYWAWLPVQLAGAP